MISKAVKPNAANRPGRLVLAGMAGMLVFVLPGIGMVLLDVRSQRVSSVNEVQDRLGLPMFGSVPMLPSRVTRGLDGSSKRGRRWQAVLSEAVSGIRANLLRVSDVRVVMVTSSVGGEGKTTVATQLAMSLARIGKRTALVDFDLPRPAVNNVFDLPLEPGICDVLRSDCSLEDVVHEVPLPNLTVITSGIADAASSRYMNSSRLAEVLDELRDQFDYVIVDGSPLDSRGGRSRGEPLRGRSDLLRAAGCQPSEADSPGRRYPDDIQRAAAWHGRHRQAGHVLPLPQRRSRRTPPVHRRVETVVSCLSCQVVVSRVSCISCHVVGGSPPPSCAVCSP